MRRKFGLEILLKPGLRINQLTLPVITRSSWYAPNEIGVDIAFCRFSMPTFQDSLLISEVFDWITLLQPFHEEKLDKVVSSNDFESDSEDGSGADDIPASAI